MFQKLKLWLHLILRSFAGPSRAKKMLDQVVEHYEGIRLTDRTEEKRQAYIEWSKPEAIAARIKQFEEEAPKALARAKAMGAPDELEPIPPRESLPPWLRNQADSFIRAALKNGFEPESY